MSSSAGDDPVQRTRHLLSQVAALPPERKPQHVAIIMDGNGRWAAQRGLPRVAGHEAGTENIRRITHAVMQAGVQYLTLWAFSTENWRRPAEEIDSLMRILGEAIEREIDELNRNGVRLRHIGSLTGLPLELQESVGRAVALTAENRRLVLTLAFNYGSRQEISQAIQEIIRSGVTADLIDEDLVSQYLYTCELPDPDLIIRTSGELRMSNFLLWQAAFAELHFTPVFWPDFDSADFLEAVLEYSRRERRFGNTISTPESGRTGGVPG